jgi:CubicO group peptidase (beta-lactamase class C family)
VFEQGVEDGVILGGVLVVSQGENVSIRTARGAKLPPTGDAGAPPIELDTVFDLGGVTTALCTASLLMRLSSAGKIAVADRASRYLQSLGIGQKAQLTIAHLLSHASGFGALPLMYDELMKANAGPRPGILTSSGAKTFVYNQISKLQLRFEPGAKQFHSDINYILLGQLIEVVTGLSLEKAFFKYVAAPLQLKSVSFIDLTLMRRKNLTPMVEMFAPTGDCPKRGRLVAGEVWDESAWAMGGVAGHSGLFGIASEVHAWAGEMLKGFKGESSVFTKDLTRSFFEPDVPGLKPGWKLGWDASSKEAGFAEGKSAPQAVVTSGATGCSVFIDPERELVAVLLSNAGFSGHLNRRFHPWRSELHTALLESA